MITGKKHQVFRLSFDAKALEGKVAKHDVLDYIHHNPVNGKWNLVSDFMDYEYSRSRFYESWEHGEIKIYHYLDAPAISEFPTDNSDGD